MVRMTANPYQRASLFLLVLPDGSRLKIADQIGRSVDQFVAYPKDVDPRPVDS